jgi:hypothetical protein
MLHPVALPHVSLGEFNGDGFSNFMHPTFVHETGPVLWNLLCINLEHLSIINIAKKSDLQWLVTYASLQLSSREQKLRERKEAKDGEDHRALSALGICQIKVSDQELRLWRENLAAFVERSRQWEHLSSCEFHSVMW